MSEQKPFDLEEFITRDLERGFQVAERGAVFSGKLVTGSHPRRREPCAKDCPEGGKVLEFRAVTP